MTEAWMEEVVRRVVEQLSGEKTEAGITIPMLSVESMVEVSLGLAISDQAKEIRQALQSGKPVRVTELETHRYRSTVTPGLWRLWEAAEGRLTTLGVQIGSSVGGRSVSPAHRPLITVKRAEELARRGELLPDGAIVTPAAADYWKQLGR